MRGRGDLASERIATMGIVVRGTYIGHHHFMLEPEMSDAAHHR